MTIREIEASVKHCYSTWSQSYYSDYYDSENAYPPVHRDLLKQILTEAGVELLLDAGCGPVSFLREMADTGIELFGFDLTPEMVQEGQRVFRSLNLPVDRIWEGSVLDAAAFCSPVDQPPNGFDATIASGVLPHIPAESDVRVIENMRDSVKPNGLVIAEARNELFALFTLNRYSCDFICDELIKKDQLQADCGEEAVAVAAALKELQQGFRMDLPPMRGGKEDEPGYDEVLSRTHNPFILKQQFVDAGLREVDVLFYHFHCLPPMFEAMMPQSFRKQSLAMENPHDWRGHFMASAFFVTGRR